MTRPAGLPVAGAVDACGEATMALGILAAALTVIYAIAGATLVGTLPGSGAGLLTIAVGQALLAIAVARGAGPRVLRCAAGAELLLAGAWLASRTAGLPTTHPIGLVDALVAADELLVALLAASIAGGALRAGPAVQMALVLTAVSITVLAGGHTHSASAANLPAGAAERAAPHFYCRLL